MKSFVVEKGVRQLFLDDFGLDGMGTLKRVVKQPTRHPENPVVEGEHPWEKANASVYGTVIYDENLRLFRMWYLCTPGPPPSGWKWVEVGGYRRVTNCTLLAYATSKDGVSWEKPVLNELSYEGSRENNLVDIGIDNPEGVSILLDPHDPEANRRYKAFFWDRRLSPPDDPAGIESEAARVPEEPSGLSPEQSAGGMWVAFSPDGITWETIGPVLPQGSDTTQAVVYDANRNKYVAFGRLGFGRTVARSESDDFLHWSEPELVLTCDAQDGPAAQIYGMPIDLYEGLYVGMIWIYREGTDGKIDTQLAMSRDGRHWQRVAERQTFLPNGPDGSRDDGMSRVVARYILKDDTMYLYYSMVNGPHRGPRFPSPVREFPPAIGLVTLRRDGFVSLEAGHQEGTVLTKPFVNPGGSLHLNVDAGNGAVRVTVCDEKGESLKGYETPEPLSTDSTKAAIVWKQGDLSKLVGHTIRLRISARNAGIYSYWFE